MHIQYCTSPWRTALVNSNGDVHACCHGSKPLGNINDQNFSEIWNGPNFQSLRQHILEGRVHSACEDAGCPFLTQHPAISPEQESLKKEVPSAEFSKNAKLAFEEYEKGATVVSNQPVELILGVTTTCNIKCVMCPHAMGHVTHPQEMSVPLYDSISEQIEHASLVVTVGVGEPLMSKVFWRILKETKPRTDLFLRTNTNGLVLTSDKADSIAASALSEISFSLDAATTETYRKIRGGDFSKAIQGIAKMVTARSNHPGSELKIFVNITLMLENVGELSALVILCKGLGVDAIIVSQLFGFGDSPDWKVKREDWEFVYSDQMIRNDSDLVESSINAAFRTAKEVGMPLKLECNTDQYLKTKDSDVVQLVHV